MDSRECRAALEIIDREAEALVDLLDRNEDPGDLRERCRRLRAAVCKFGRRCGTGAGTITAGSDITQPADRAPTSECMRAVQEILTFPYPASNRAPRHQLYGWLAHVRYCAECGLGRSAPCDTATRP